MTNASTEWTAGYETAGREMRTDGWTAEAARAFLTAIGSLECDGPRERDYGRGYNAAIRQASR